MTKQNDNFELLGLTADIVSAHVAHNGVTTSELPDVIRQVYDVLEELGSKSVTSGKPYLRPFVPIHKSIMPDYIICLEDGKQLKMLKRHLKTAYDMTPLQYREKWGLPSDYPMVAPNYAKKRSALAKEIGLGTSTRNSSA